MYFLAFPNDQRSSKLLVLGVYLFEATQTFLLTQSAFHAFAEGFGNLLFLDQIGTFWFSVCIMSGLVAFVAQAFYAYRISILAQNKVVASLIMFLAFVQLGGAIATGVLSKLAKFSSRFLDKKSYISTGFWNGGSALCDAMIAISMTIYLSRRDTGMKHTSVILKKIIVLTIETGSATAVIALLNFILALLPNRPTYYMTTAGMLGKLYSNSMLAVFNSRMRMGSASSSHGVSSSSSGHHASNVSSNFNHQRFGGKGHQAKPRHDGDAYEMHGGPVSVAVLKEQVTFPDENWKLVQPRISDDNIPSQKLRQL